jgi:hypothetical protein
MSLSVKDLILLNAVPAKFHVIIRCHSVYWLPVSRVQEIETPVHILDLQDLLVR